jgi:hypothetical protein
MAIARAINDLGAGRLRPCLVVLLASFHGLFAVSEIEAIRASEPPRIDGILDDAVWQDSAQIDQFLQREPVLGAPASEETEVWIALDDRNLYFAFRCHDDPASVTAKELARDADLGQDDRVQIILDTFLDGRNAYWFQIGPRGSIGDALVSANGERFNKQWDGLWDGRAKINDLGWEAEVVIQFKTLRFRPGQDRWGLKLIRHIKRREESVYWPEANLDAFRFQVSDSGILLGMEGMSQGIGLDIQPYGLLGINQFKDEEDDAVADAGVDLFYQLTPGMSSALTVNTDFAETEVDLRQVNLTRFPLFFPEKRDFFLDGANYFDFGPSQPSLIAFFSRRIGLDPDGSPIPILWGAKLTGQQSNWNLGLLGISDNPGEERRDFFVGRVSRNLGTQSSLGIIFTHGNALAETRNQVFGVDLRLASSTFRGNKNISLGLYGLKSFTQGISGRDNALGVQLLYPNDFLNIETGFQQIEENFSAGVGFIPRTGIRSYTANLHLGPRPERLGIRQLRFGGGVEYITNMENRLETRRISLLPIALRYDSGDEISFEVEGNHEFLEEDFQIHPDFLIQAGFYDFVRYRAVFQSAQRRDLWVGGSVAWGSFFDGQRKDLLASVGYKVSVPLFVGAEFSRSHVDLPEGGFAANISRFNLNLLFSPNMTLYNFIQYDNFSEDMGWQSRFYWILKPGNEIIIAWNSRWHDPLSRFHLTESTARFKVNYNFRF